MFYTWFTDESKKAQKENRTESEQEQEEMQWQKCFHTFVLSFFDAGEWENENEGTKEKSSSLS